MDVWLDHLPIIVFVPNRIEGKFLRLQFLYKIYIPKTQNSYFESSSYTFYTFHNFFFVSECFQGPSFLWSNCRLLPSNCRRLPSNCRWSPSNRRRLPSNRRRQVSCNHRAGFDGCNIFFLLFVAALLPVTVESSVCKPSGVWCATLCIAFGVSAPTSFLCISGYGPPFLLNGGLRLQASPPLCEDWVLVDKLHHLLYETAHLRHWHSDYVQTPPPPV